MIWHLSEHFTLDEFVRSKTASERKIDNTPTPEIIERLTNTALGMERIRHSLGELPVMIQSGYRCEALNKAVGGSEGSQHIKGEACDFTCPAFGAPLRIATYLQYHLKILSIDQLILEHTWLHASFSLKPRHQVLTHFNGRYLPGIA